MKISEKIGRIRGMTIEFKAPAMSHPEAVEISDFMAFRSWLSAQGVGDETPQDWVVAEWAECYRDMASGKRTFVSFGVARGKHLGSIHLKVVQQ